MLTKISALLVTGCIAASLLGYFYWYNPAFYPQSQSFKPNIVNERDNTILLKKLQQKAVSLKKYCKTHGYNEQVAFLIDMSIHEGKQRFFVYDLQNNRIKKAGLVTHGSGSETGTDQLYFSNVPNSNCTSLGRYKIGKKYQGKFGLAYKLHGLDASNNKAFERFVVLHGHRCVPSREVYPISICPSLGCPTVAPDFLLELKKFIDTTDEPILLSIYD
jgi:hypothetical protein